MSTVVKALKRTSEAKALVFFTPYRPWLLEKDLAFFDLAREAGFKVEKLLEQVMDRVMFDEDPGVSDLPRYYLSRGKVTRYNGAPLTRNISRTSFFGERYMDINSAGRSAIGHHLKWMKE